MISHNYYRRNSDDYYQKLNSEIHASWGAHVYINSLTPRTIHSWWGSELFDWTDTPKNSQDIIYNMILSKMGNRPIVRIPETEWLLPGWGER